MTFIVKIGITCLNVLYFFIKLCPVKNKITYISRQLNTTPTDFKLIIQNIKQKAPTIQQVVLAKRIPSGFAGKIGYCFHMLKQMYHIATSKMVIIDTYCIPVSILNQRKDLIVIQIWHALGAFKKFGYSILDQEEGSSSKIAHLMKMHYNYTYVLTSSEYTLPFFSEAFHVSKEQMKVFPLPKIDLLLDENKKQDIIHRIYEKYPRLKNTHKKKIVYVPTFRKNDNQNLYRAIQDLINYIDYEKYEFIIKTHPLTTFQINDERVIEDKIFDSLEFFHIADIIVTDYSAVLFEAIMLDKPIYFYAFDYEQYAKNRSFYIDYFKDMPSPVQTNAQELIKVIESGCFDQQRMKDFKDKMIAPCQKSYTDDLTEFLLLNLKK